MKNFLFGFFTALAVIACFVFGALYILGEKVEDRLNAPWEETKETALQLSIYPNVDIELSDALGLSPQELADFLSQGDELKKKSYLSVLNSGLDIDIETHYEADGPSRTQRIHFRDGKLENNIIEAVVEVELIRDEISDSTPHMPQGLQEILESDGLEKLKWRAKQQRLSVDELQKTKETEPADTDNPGNPPENPKNQPDD